MNSLAPNSLDRVRAVKRQRAGAVGQQRDQVEVRVDVRVELAGLRAEQAGVVAVQARPGVAGLRQPAGRRRSC